MDIACQIKDNSVFLFDSGIGGITVLDELLSYLPHENYVYIADEKYCPYGDRGDDFISERLYDICLFIKNFNPKALIIACNTASRFKNIFYNVLDSPIFDVITPTVEYAKKMYFSKKVLLLATESTVKGSVYQNEFKKLGIYCHGLACNNFVPFIEDLKVNTSDFINYVVKIFSSIELSRFDTVIYGCTHYGFADKVLRKFIKKNVNVVSCAKPVALAFSDIFGKYLKSETERIKGSVTYLTTGNKSDFLKKLKFYDKLYGNCFSVSSDYAL